MAIKGDIEQAKSIGLVFAGGAALGAYEIGIWQVLKDRGIDKKITCVSGSSVGALNTIFFAANLYEEAHMVWSGIKCSDVLDGFGLKVCQLSSPKPQQIQDSGKEQDDTEQILKEIESMEFTFGYHNVIRHPAQTATLTDVEKKLSCGSAFSDTNALKHLIETNVNPNFSAIRNGLPFYLTRVRVDDVQLEYVTNQAQSKTEHTFTIRDSQNLVANLLATSAATPLYDCADVDGVKYRDGGQVGGDNTPYTVLEENESPEKVIVCSLTPNDPLPPKGDDKYIVIKLDPKYYSTTNLVKFQSAFAKELIAEGIKDAKRVLGQ